LAAAQVERIRTQAGGSDDGSGSGPLTFSAGWATILVPSSRAAVTGALQAADAALREAKTAGRNCTRPA
jgi:GGDEF domain-containing protein